MKGKLAVICLLLFILCSISTVYAENTNDTQIMQENNALDNLEASEDAILMDTSDDLQKIINSASDGSTVTLNKSYTISNRINIDKSVTINGGGNTIDCSKASVRSSSGHITLKNLKFANGNADNGAAIYITGSAKYTIINCTFTNNKVNNFGGAIYNNVVDTLTITNCKFTGNEANSYGGAIYSKGNMVIDKSVFENNHGKDNGGAISCEKSAEISNSVFTSNKVVDFRMDSYGGAVYAKKDSFFDNCTFRENSATKGGAIYSSSDFIIENSHFIKNTANQGGAIKAGNDNHIYIENTTFKQNSAKSNGGGAIYSNKWIHIGNSIFELNTANNKGGAIETDYIQFSGTNRFINNSANDHGGAVYTDKIGDTNNNLIFNGNHADKDFGGAIYINKKSGNVKFSSSIFTNNHANAGDGGAIYSDSSSTNLEFYNCTFASNYAAGGKEKRYGGAVRSCGNVKVNNCTFKDNWAENYGGAIYTSTINEIKNSVFLSNQVKNGGTRYGGAIYVNNACTMTISGNYFEKNGGGSRGGVLYTDSKNAHLKLTNNAFIENSASDQGVSVFHSGYYDDISNNWWGMNGAKIGNQLKEYHTVGSNSDKNDGKPLVVSLVADKNIYSSIKTTIKVSFTGAAPYYVLDTLKYSSNKNGTFITKKINSDSLELIYVPNENGIHKIDFTINSQKLSCDLNVTYISVYGYDIQKIYGDNQLYSAVFKDKNGKYLPKGTKVTFNVNNANHVREIIDNDGVAILNANLEPGQYTVKAINNVTGQSYTNKITVSKRNAIYNIYDPYIIQLNASANKTVTFKVGGKTFTGLTTKEGLAHFILNVTAGNYTVETTFAGKTFKDFITVTNKYAILDLGLKGTSYGALLPVYANETFTKASDAAMYSVLGKDTYRYIMGTGEAFILYNVTVSNSQELTEVLRKMASSDYKVDVTTINLKKNTYKVTENFWRDSEWYYLVHLTHGSLIIHGNGATIEDNYKHNFMSLDSNTRVMVDNLEFKKFYRVFANAGEVYSEKCTYTENNAKFWATKTRGSVIHNMNKATFNNCIFNGNDNGGNREYNDGGVLYADTNSLTDFIKCSFKTKDDNVRAVAKSMVVIYDDDWNAFEHVEKNGYFDYNASLCKMTLNSLTKNMTKTFHISDMNGFNNFREWLDGSNDATLFNVTLDKGEYIISADELKKYRDKYDWRSAISDPSVIMIVWDRSYLDIKSKPVIINGNGATIKLTGNDASDDYHFAYVPNYGSLTLINMTLSGFNTAILNYGTFTAINCTFKDNIIHHKIKIGDYGGAIRNFGNVYCYDSLFKDNGANKGGAYYSIGKSAKGVFYNCQFTGNVIKSNLVWKNNDKNDFDIEMLSVARLVNCKGLSPSTIKTEDEGIYLLRESLNNTVYNVVVDNLASLMRASKVVNGNTKYDIMNITLVKGDYGTVPNSQSLFKVDYGLLIINGAGARVFVQNQKDDDTTQFLTTTTRANVQINNLTVEGFNIAIENKGKLTITNSIFNNNKVDYKYKSDYGGAIVNNGLLSVFNSTFTNNYAKYGGAIYTTGSAKVIMSIFKDNTGYSSVPNLKTKIDIYNNDGSLEDVVIFGNKHNNYENHPMASWVRDVTESGFTLLILSASLGTGWYFAAAEYVAAPIISMGINAVVGGVLGGAYGLIYSSDHQDYSTFWSHVLKGIGSGIQFTPLGGAMNGISGINAGNYIKIALNQLYTKTAAKGVNSLKSVADHYQNEDKLVYFT
ncbi:right-handed parallel beta-helix repeat-containing protein [uncultured Methanobrevibacter sp.]|uniref:right-handed parallel beta-helix repeat-containing protein n=1 Tax=uncultured Methanobrevibacter sp. TaxID=253161 RepID=UPI0025E6B19B|nr:right-handed parallel beta-helix repeat-containing protein [uncultured Methanobrevibacter sp.]